MQLLHSYCVQQGLKGIILATFHPRVAVFDTFGQLSCPGGGEFDLFFQKMSKSPPHLRSPPPLGLNIDRSIAYPATAKTVARQVSRAVAESRIKFYFSCNLSRNNLVVAGYVTL